MQANQQVTFLSDGGDTVRALAAYLNPQADHILDWFHLTMRITVLRQCARGLAKAKATPEDERTLERRLESVKHYLWHDNVARALDELEDLECWGCDDNGIKHQQPDSEAAARLLKYVREEVAFPPLDRTLSEAQSSS